MTKKEWLEEYLEKAEEYNNNKNHFQKFVFPLTITALDYKNQTIKKISGQLLVEKTEARPLPIPWYKKIIDSI